MPSSLSRGWPAMALLVVGAASLRCSGKSSFTGRGGSGASAGQSAVSSAGSGASAGRVNAGSGGTNSVGGDAQSVGGDAASPGAGRGSGGSSGGASADGGTAGKAAGGRTATGGNNASGGNGPNGGRNATGGHGALSGDAGDQGTAGQGTECDLGPECGRGTCWTWLNGRSGCVNPKEPPPLAECFASDTDCCSSNSDCTDAPDGLCIPRIDTALTCGGAAPYGNSCNYDECADDSDCDATRPADATVATCLPRGALDHYTATCAYGACRTDADCTQGDYGQCLYGLAATHGGCDLRYVLYCAYPSDPCTDRYGTCTQPTEVCAPNDDFQGRHCVPAPPMYP